MVRFSQIVVSVANSLTLLWSIFIFCVFSIAIKDGPLECNTSNPIQTLLYGIFLFSLSLVALIGAIRANRSLLMVYSWVLFAWFVWLSVSSAFWLVVWKVSDAKVGKDPKGNQLDYYPGWLRRYADNGERWVPIKSYLVRCQICKGVLFAKDTDEGRDMQIGRTSIWYNCCQPPLNCGFMNKNGTSWEVPTSGGIYSEDPDCKSWSNNLDQVCFDCISCKVGYLETLKDEWRADGLSNAFFSILIFIGFWISFWAFRQLPGEDHNPDHHHHHPDNIASAA